MAHAFRRIGDAFEIKKEQKETIFGKGGFYSRSV